MMVMFVSLVRIIVVMTQLDNLKSDDNAIFVTAVIFLDIH